MDFLRRRRRVDEPRDELSRLDCGSATETGPRPDNQDRAAVAPGWALVSDGVGGHVGGGLAAELTVEAVVSVLGTDSDPDSDSGSAEPDGDASGDSSDDDDAAAVSAIDGVGPVDERLLRRAVEAANDAVRARRRDDPAVPDMGATLTLVAATSVGSGESRWLVASVGDSPAWRVTATGAERLTQDHTLAAELVRAGAITEEAAASHPGRNVIIRSIGADDQIDPDVVGTVLHPGEALVLASDGVSDVLDATEIHAAATDAATASAAAQRLVDTALGRGTKDNTTAAVVRHVADSRDSADSPDSPDSPE